MTRRDDRPATLAEAVGRAIAGTDPFDHAIREFLDTFYAYPDHRDAAVAEHLARCFDRPIPEWTEGHGERLRVPFFAGGLESLKARLIVESSSAFRRRLIFVSHSALDHPRSPQSRA